MKKLKLFCLCCLFLVSCTSNKLQDQDKESILDETLGASYLKMEESESKIRSEIFFDNGKSAKTCNSYLKLSINNRILETIENQLVKSEYLVCDGLSAISRFGLYTGQVQHDAAGERLLHDLDLRSFPNSLKRLTNNDSFTLKKMFPDHSSTSGNVAILDTEDWVLTLKVVAIINDNKATYPNWVMQIADESKSGNYRSYSTFIIYNIKNDAVLTAMPYP
jgi:hypothetical protein